MYYNFRYKEEYNKEQATQKVQEFLKELHELEEKYSLFFAGINQEDVLLVYKQNEYPPVGKFDFGFDFVRVGWKNGDEKITVTEKTEVEKKELALQKLTREEKRILGLI